MSTMTVLFGLLLAVYGLVVFATTDPANRSLTAMIPAFFGAPIAILGLIAALKENLRKHVMHLAAAIALVGAVGGLGMGIWDAIKQNQGKSVNDRAMTVKTYMGLACAAFVVVCARSFIEARLARKNGQSASPPASK